MRSPDCSCGLYSSIRVLDKLGVWIYDCCFASNNEAKDEADQQGRKSWIVSIFIWRLICPFKYAVEKMSQLHAPAAIPSPHQSCDACWIGDWVYPRAVLNAVEKKTIFLCWKSNLGRRVSVPSLVAARSYLSRLLLYLWKHHSTVLCVYRYSDTSQKKLRGLSPRANYTGWAAAACRRN
jgi:hypothetical protein